MNVQARTRSAAGARLLGVALLLLLAACAPRSRAAAPQPPGASVETLTTADGLRLDARLFAGDPHRIVVVLHGFSEDQEAWFGTAAWLRSAGYSVLTVDFRGYGASDGDRQAEALERDAEATVLFAQKRGYERIVLLGGAMGGAAAIVAAADNPAVDGVVALSPPTRFASLDAVVAIGRLRSPLLVAAARDDTSSAESLQVLVRRARLQPDRVVEVRGADVGGDLVRDADEQASFVQARVLAFLEEVCGRPMVSAGR